MTSLPDGQLQNALMAAQARAVESSLPLQRLTLLAEALERLNACADRAALLDVLRDYARRLVGADGVSIVLRDGERCFYARTDASQGVLWQGQHFSLLSCISGWAMLNGETALISDIYQDERIPHALYRDTFVRSLIMVPVGREESLAAIGAYWSVVRTAPPDEVALLQSLARAAGSALQRCAADERISASEQRQRLAFANTQVGFCFGSRDGHILDMNPRFSAICGYPPEELAGMHFLALTHPDDRAANGKLVADLLAGRIESFQLEKRYLHRDGHCVWVRNDVWMIDDPAGGPPQFAVAVIDVTAEREAQERLLQAQKLELLGQLTGGIAHDFNNLLTIINGSTECLAEQLEARPELLELARVIQQAGERAAELTGALLAFARRQPLAPAPVAPDQMVGAMRTLLQRTLGTDLLLDLCIGAQGAVALLDPAQFETALVNLCVNARDAMRPGGRLTIRTAQVLLGLDGEPAPAGSAGRPHVLVSVADEGMGMTAEVCARAFEPFFTTRQDQGGSGLGLSMVYGFVRQAGGQVRIDSAPGKGCVVSMYLPCAEGPAAAGPAPVSAARRGSGERVLVVEDEAGVRDYVARALRGLGYVVQSADCPLAALSLLEQGERCDLLLTDLLMPGAMDGVALARRVRQLRPGLPIVVMTGYADRMLEEHGAFLASGELLHKPFRRAELGRAIAAGLGRDATGSPG